MTQVINSTTIKEIYKKSTDVLVRPIDIKSAYHLTLTIFCVDGLVNSQVFDLTIIKPLTEEGAKRCSTQEALFEYFFKNGGAYHAFASETSDMDKLITCVMSGMVGLIFDDLQKAILFDVRTFDKRSVSEPAEEGVMKGAKDSFIEVLRTNTALIRRRIRSPYLVIEQMYVGKQSRTDVALVYLSNICDMSLVDKIRKQLQSIDIDNIAAASFVEEYLVPPKQTLMPQILLQVLPSAYYVTLPYWFLFYYQPFISQSLPFIINCYQSR